ncbi:DUF4221 family protein [Arundinibacter roseus]|nr:DUF4221 family protein [Arundinibacter roseus]
MKKPLLLLHLLVVFSCTQRSDRTSQENSELSKSTLAIEYKKTINLNLDNKTSNWSSSIQYYEDSKNKYLILASTSTNSVQFYDLNGNLQKEVTCEWEGPESTGKMQSFLYTGKDSLYILNINTHRIFRLSDKGKVLKLYQLEPWKTDDYFTIPFAICAMPMEIVDDKLYIPGLPGVYYFKNPTDYLTKGKLTISLDLKTGEHIEQINHPNKEKFLGKNYGSDLLYAHRTFNPITQTFIHSFPGDHSIYSYTMDGKLIDTKELKSDYADDVLKEMANWASVDDSYKEYFHYLKNTIYEGLYFDKYRNIYYRLVKHGTNTIYSKEDVDNKKPIDCRCSLIVADKDLNKIDEIVLEKGVRHHLVVVTPEGLLILNKKNPQENIIALNLYEIKVK